MLALGVGLFYAFTYKLPASVNRDVVIFSERRRGPILLPTSPTPYSPLTIFS